jgi:hypothetical protein
MSAAGVPCVKKYVQGKTLLQSARVIEALND